MMEKSKLELIVGVFVLVGIVCLGYLSIKLGKLELIGGDVYEVDAQFNSASGLKAWRGCRNRRRGSGPSQGDQAERGSGDGETGG